MERYYIAVKEAKAVVVIAGSEEAAGVNAMKLLSATELDVCRPLKIGVPVEIGEAQDAVDWSH